MPYVPPHLRRQAAAEAAAAAKQPGASSSVQAAAEKQRQQAEWGKLTRAIVGAINRVTLTNVPAVVVDLMRNNIIRGRGFFCKQLMQTQLATPEMSHVFASMMSLINKEFPAIGELLVHRLIIMWKRYYKRKEWNNLHFTGTFMAHLVGQRVQHQLVLLKMLSTLLCVQPHPNDDEVQAATNLLRESYKFLDAYDPSAFDVLLQPMRQFLRNADGTLTQRSESYIQQLLDEIREWEPKKNDEPMIPIEIDLVDPDEQKMHELDLEDSNVDLQMKLDRFTEVDPDYEENEKVYETLARAIVGDEVFDMKEEEERTKEEARLNAKINDVNEEEEEEPVDASQIGVRKAGGGKGTTRGKFGGEDNAVDEDDGEEEIVDDDDMMTTKAAEDPFAFFSNTESENIRKNIYHAIKSSASNIEVAHKLLRDHSKPETDGVVAMMLLETCCQEKMFNKKYTLTAERLCQTAARFRKLFMELLKRNYEDAENLSKTKIEMICKFYVPLFIKGAVDWNCLGMMDIKKSYEQQNSSQGVFIQDFWQTLASSFGMQRLKERLRNDVELQPHLQGLFPFGNMRDVAFAIQFFQAMDLGALAEDLQKWYDKEQLKAHTSHHGVVPGSAGAKRKREDGGEDEFAAKGTIGEQMAMEAEKDRSFV